MLTQKNIFKQILCLAIFCAASLPAQEKITVYPNEYADALSNPLKGFRPYDDDWNRYTYPTLVHEYIKWNEIENDESDTVDKITDWCNREWAGFPEANIKVIPRVYIDWDSNSGNEYWPSDLQKGDWTSQEFKDRIVRLIYRLGEAWDNDPRVAWVQTGIIGYWGEQENPVGIGDNNNEFAKLLGPAFENAFPNKMLVVRNQNHWEAEGFEWGVYWDSFAHPGQRSGSWKRIQNANAKDRYLFQPVEGEVAYNWGEDVMDPYIGGDPDPTLRTPIYRNNLIDVIRELHCSALGWVASYTQSDPAAAEGAALVQKEFGYRFVMSEFSCPRRAEPGDALNISFKVKNTGAAPFYENWPLALVFIDESAHQIVSTISIPDVDIRTWHPGDQYDYNSRTYTIPAVENEVDFSVMIPADLAAGQYLAGISILEPYSQTPGLFFAMENFLKESQTQPLCRIGIGEDVSGGHEIDDLLFDDPVSDDQRYYTLEWNGAMKTLTTSAVAGGSVYPVSGRYPENHKVRLEAEAELGYEFDGWTGDFTGSENPATITMDTDKNIMATFKSVPTYTLTIDAENGAVSFDPEGGVYNKGTVVALTASAEIGYIFSGWEGDLTGSENPKDITMDADKNVTALFASVPVYTLTTTAVGGTVVLDPPGPQYSEGTVVDVKAEANPDYVFTGWSGDPLDFPYYMNPNRITMDSDKSITAGFSGPPEQTGLWIETFDLPDATTLDEGDTPWTAMRSAGKFEVSGNRLMLNDAGPEGVFTTGEIDISGGSVSISINIEGAGGLDPEGSENEDYFGIFIKVDGGEEQLIYENYGFQSVRTVSETGISGSTLVLIIKGYTTAGDEIYYFDNLKVKDTSVPNLLANGDFSQRDAHWNLQVISPAAAVFYYDQGECRVEIQSVTDEEWHVNILQPGINLKSGIDYTLTFDARATADKQVTAKAQFDHDPWTSSLEEPVMITTHMQTYSVVWNQKEAAGTYKVGLFFGADTTDVWVDNIKLTGETQTAVDKPELFYPHYTRLMQNYPNPFNPETTIPYELSAASHVRLDIVNFLGQRVATLVNEHQPAGFYQVKWQGKTHNGHDVSSGIYIYRLTAIGGIQTRKFIFAQ